MSGLGHFDGVVDLVPGVHHQVTRLRIHGVERAARVTAAKHLFIARAGSYGVREARDGRGGQTDDGRAAL